MRQFTGIGVRVLTHTHANTCIQSCWNICKQCSLAGFNLSTTVEEHPCEVIKDSEATLNRARVTKP